MIERMSGRSTWEERNRNQKERRSDATTEVQKKNGKKVENWRNEAGDETEEWG